MNKKELISSKEIYRILGIKKDCTEWIKYWIKNLNLKENIDYVINKCKSTGGRPSIDYMFTKESISSIISRSNSENVKKAMDYIGLEVKHIHTYDRFEILFKDMLKRFLPEIKFEEQKQIGKYRVDFFYEYLIIEYDEEHHKSNTKKDEKRENDITKIFVLDKKYKHDRKKIFNNFEIIRIEKGMEIEGLREISDYFKKIEKRKNPLPEIISEMIIERRKEEEWVNNIVHKALN
jgi:very-short-patch-repair endonuclease